MVDGGNERYPVIQAREQNVPDMLISSKERWESRGPSKRALGPSKTRVGVHLRSSLYPR